MVRLYQQCFMTVDPYLLACAIVAYTRKYMGVAVIWRQELELLAKTLVRVEVRAYEHHLMVRAVY